MHYAEGVVRSLHRNALTCHQAYLCSLIRNSVMASRPEHRSAVIREHVCRGERRAGMPCQLISIQEGVGLTCTGLTYSSITLLHCWTADSTEFMQNMAGRYSPECHKVLESPKSLCP